MEIGERHLFIAEFFQNGCQIGDFCFRQGEEWMHVQQEEQLQEGDARQPAQAEHLTMQNAQCKTSRISQSTMQEKQNFTVYCRQVIVQCTMQECRTSRIAHDATH